MLRSITGFLLVLLILIPATAITGAQRPDAPQYAQRGPYPVGTTEVTIDDGQGLPLTAAIWYPALNPDGAEESVTYRVLAFTLEGHALQDAAPDTDHGPYPLVVFSHGNRGLRYQSLFLTEHLASYGFVVIAIDHPGNTLLDSVQDSQAFVQNMAATFANRPLDILRVLAYAEGMTAPDGPFAGLVDMDRIGISGHSLGGYTALGVAGAQVDTAGLDTWCSVPVETDPGVAGLPVPPPRSDDDLHMDVCWMLSQASAIANLRGMDSVPDGLWPATSDPRIGAVLLLAPWGGPVYGPDGLAQVTAPTLLLVGTADDSAPPIRDAYPIYRDIASEQKGIAVFSDAAHYVFVDTCPAVAVQLGLFEECSDQVWDMARIHDLTNHLSTAFLLATLSGDADAALQLSAVDFRGVSYLHTP